MPSWWAPRLAGRNRHVSRASGPVWSEGRYKRASGSQSKASEQMNRLLGFNLPLAAVTRTRKGGARRVGTCQSLLFAIAQLGNERCFTFWRVPCKEEAVRVVMQILTYKQEMHVPLTAACRCSEGR
eukprot:scaffold181994_cov14-Tisochrysis_lutea.AAC.1